MLIESNGSVLVIIIVIIAVIRYSQASTMKWGACGVVSLLLGVLCGVSRACSMPSSFCNLAMRLQTKRALCLLVVVRPKKNLPEWPCNVHYANESRHACRPHIAPWYMRAPPW